MELSELIAIVAAIPGILGLGLGIINTRTDVQRDRVRLEVKPERPYVQQNKKDQPPYDLSVEIINHSDFPVTIASIGFLLNDGRHIVWPQESQMRTFYCTLRPHRLESHASCVHSILVDATMPDFERIVGIYAQTQCGAMAVKRRSTILKEVLAAAATNRERTAKAENASVPSSSAR